MSVLSVLEWMVWGLTLLAGLWFAADIRRMAVHRVPPQTWPTLIVSLALVSLPVIFLFLPFSKLHIVWLLIVIWPLSLMAGVSYIPLVSQLLIWPAYFYACVLMVGTGVSLPSPSKQSPWAARDIAIPLRYKDNYELIAMNLTYIHHLITKRFHQHFASDEQILLAAGLILIDAMAYLQEGSISPQKIQLALWLAQKGQCSLPFAEQIHEKGATEVELMLGIHDVKDLFLNFTMQIECLIFNVDTDLREDLIVSSVISKKKAIRRAIQRTLSNAGKGDYPEGLDELVEGILSSEEFQGMWTEIDSE